jgi:hypothetical protein
MQKYEHAQPIALCECSAVIRVTTPTFNSSPNNQGPSAILAATFSAQTGNSVQIPLETIPIELGPNRYFRAHQDSSSKAISSSEFSVASTVDPTVDNVGIKLILNKLSDINARKKPVNATRSNCAIPSRPDEVRQNE